MSVLTPLETWRRDGALVLIASFARARRAGQGGVRVTYVGAL